MNKHKMNLIYILMLISILVSGSFFEYISCAYTIVILVISLFTLIKKKSIVYSADYNLIAISLFCIMYLISSLYAIDTGYAVLGFFKFMPFILMYFLLCDKPDTREYIIQLLPVTGAVITFLTSIMMLFSVFKPYVTVAGRLSGTFQYPNTFALFLLICILAGVWQKDRIKYLYIAVNVIGIIETGCRSVFVITIITFIIIALCQKKYRLGIIIFTAVAAVGIVLLVVFAGNTILAERIKSISFTSSTLMGRLLYYKDALPVILRHPFGLGYYGYFFIQGEIQTGVYSVANVHNELLQIMLDIGIIPAIMFFAMLIKTIISKKSPLRNKIIISVIIMHSMLDYNFQFMAILFIMLLFLQYGEVKSQRVGIVTYAISGVISVGLIYGALIHGLSMFNYNTGNYQTAYNIGHFNTMALIKQLEQVDDTQKGKDIAESIIERNKHVDIAYNAMARYSLSDNDIEKFILYELKCIELSPYNHDYYVEFADYLFEACNIYLNNSQLDSAKICYAQLQGIPDMFQKLSDKTSELAWKINDIPQFGMPVEYYTLIEQYGEKISNYE